MARGEKLLERMRRNPRDWRIEDVVAVCEAFAIDCDRPSGGSHYGIGDPTQRRHLTVPFARPIKPVYISARWCSSSMMSASPKRTGEMVSDQGAYKVVIEPLSDDDGGGFLASVPELPGCMSDGETRVEALANVEDAIDTWLHSARKMGRLVPSPSFHRAA